MILIQPTYNRSCRYTSTRPNPYVVEVQSKVRNAAGEANLTSMGMTT